MILSHLHLRSIKEKILNLKTLCVKALLKSFKIGILIAALIRIHLRSLTIAIQIEKSRKVIKAPNNPLL